MVPQSLLKRSIRPILQPELPKDYIYLLIIGSCNISSVATTYLYRCSLGFIHLLLTQIRMVQRFNRKKRTRHLEPSLTEEIVRKNWFRVTA